MFVHHPDGWVSLHGERVSLQALTDLVSAYSLPDGATGRRYDGQRHVLHSQTDQWAGSVPWPMYDAIVAAWSDIADRDAEITASERPAPPDPWARPLPEIQADALARIDDDAERRRAMVLTLGAGQALEYSQTQSEAEALTATGGTPDPAAYPMLEAERLALADAGVTVTLTDVAAQVLAARDAWTAYGAAIKRARRAGKMAVIAAVDAAGIQTAEAAIQWPAIPEIPG